MMFEYYGVDVDDMIYGQSEMIVSER